MRIIGTYYDSGFYRRGKGKKWVETQIPSKLKSNYINED